MSMPMPPLPTSTPLMSPLLARLEDERSALRTDLQLLTQALKDGYITSREYAFRSDDLHSQLFDLQKAIDQEVRAAKLQMAKTVLMYQQRMVFGGPGSDTGKETPLPEETAFGEVLGYRVWRLPPMHGPIVTSCYRTDYVWTPQKVEEERYTIVRDHNQFGFHAWNNPNRAVGYAMGLGLGVVIGRVKLWGIVIHHQHGYRAQFAKIAAFDFVVEEVTHRDDQMLLALRKTYGVEETP